MELGRLGELIEKLAEKQTGVKVMPVRPDTPSGDSSTFGEHGWVVGFVTPEGGGDLATGPTIADAVERVFDHIDAENE